MSAELSPPRSWPDTDSDQAQAPLRGFCAQWLPSSGREREHRARTTPAEAQQMTLSDQELLCWGLLTGWGSRDGIVAAQFLHCAPILGNWSFVSITKWLSVIQFGMAPPSCASAGRQRADPAPEGHILCPQLTRWGPRVCVILGKWPNLSELQIPIGHTPVAPRSRRFREGADNLPDPRLQGTLPERPESEHEDSPPEMLRMAALGSEPQKPIW